LAADSQFTYEYKDELEWGSFIGSPKHNVARAGYSFLEDIVFPTQARPANGFFLQLNEVNTFVLTSDNEGHLNKTLYIVDTKAITPKIDRYAKDRLSGPMFDPDLGPGAALVLSVVRKRQGFTCDQPIEANGTKWSGNPARAKRFLDSMDPSFARGRLPYTYLYLNGTNLSKLPYNQDALIANVEKKLDEFLGQQKDPEDYPSTGLLVYSLEEILSALKNAKQIPVKQRWVVHALYSRDPSVLGGRNLRSASVVAGAEQ
jgi:hypothetical protein